MDNSNIREQQITRTSVIGIVANIFLAAFKAAVGLFSHSIAIVLDAVNNLTDAMSSVITILGVKLAKRRPDDKHPFGYGRIEYFSAVIIAAIVLAAGATSLIESVKKIITPETPDYSAVTLVIVAVAVVVKLVLGRYVKGQGEKYNSEALVASGSDASFDAIISASTLVGAVINMLFKLNLDGIIGASSPASSSRRALRCSLTPSAISSAAAPTARSPARSANVSETCPVCWEPTT